MAITHLDTNTGGEPGTTGSVVITKPDGVASGDVLVAFACTNELTITVPAGFTQVALSANADTPGTFSGGMWYKVAGGSEPASYTFSKSADGGPIAVSLSAFRGCNTTSPIDVSSEIAGGAAGEPANPATSVTQTASGHLVYARFTRNVSGTSGVAEAPAYSNGTAGWSELGEAAAFSGATVNYGVGVYAADADTGAGAQTEPAITVSRTETDNVYILAALLAAPEGDVATSLAPVVAALAGDHRISGVLGTELSPVVAAFAGNGGPTAGTLDTVLSSVVADAEGTATGGTVGATLPAVTSAFEGAVVPSGGFECQLAPVTCAFVMETKPFGEHVISVEADHRSFLIIDDDPGLLPIKRSAVYTTPLSSPLAVEADITVSAYDAFVNTGVQSIESSAEAFQPVARITRDASTVTAGVVG